MFGLDYGTWRGVYTVLVLVLFIGVVWWAFGSKRRKKQFDEAANSIFDEQDSSVNSKKQESKNHE